MFKAIIIQAIYLVLVLLEHGVEANAEKTPSDVILLSKAYQLGSKVQRRVYARAMKRLRGVQLRARETIGQLNYTVDLVG